MPPQPAAPPAGQGSAAAIPPAEHAQTGRCLVPPEQMPSAEVVWELLLEEQRVRLRMVAEARSGALARQQQQAAQEPDVWQLQAVDTPSYQAQQQGSSNGHGMAHAAALGLTLPPAVAPEAEQQGAVSGERSPSQRFLRDYRVWGGAFAPPVLQAFASHSTKPPVEAPRCPTPPAEHVQSHLPLRSPTTCGAGTATQPLSDAGMSSSSATLHRASVRVHEAIPRVAQRPGQACHTGVVQEVEAYTSKGMWRNWGTGSSNV